MKNTKNKTLALKLLEYHGGQYSGLYAVGSCMLSDAMRGVSYNPANHYGHVDNAIPRAIKELTEHQTWAREHGERKQVRECARLIVVLVVYLRDDPEVKLYFWCVRDGCNNREYSITPREFETAGSAETCEYCGDRCEFVRAVV